MNRDVTLDVALDVTEGLTRRALLLALAAAPLAACGLEGPPRPPEGEEERYRLRERRYPAPETVRPPQEERTE